MQTIKRITILAGLVLALAACDKASDAAGSAADKAKATAGKATDKTKSALKKAGDKAGAAADKAKAAAVKAGDKAGEAAAKAGEAAAKAGEAAAKVGEKAAAAVAPGDALKIQEEGIAFMEKLATAMDANKADCAKVAEAVTTIGKANAAVVAKMKAFSKTEAGKKEPEGALKDRMTAAQKKMEPVMKGCKENAAVGKAFMSIFM